MKSTVPALSCLPDKLTAFTADPYFRDAWDDLVGFSTDETEIAGLLTDAAALVLRPDTLLSGRPAQVLRAVLDAGFQPVATAWFAFTRHVIRETWRYQLNIATRDRIDVMDLVLRGEQALYVLLEHHEHPAGIPATTLLSGMKGPSAPENREPGHLRAIAGPAQESVLTYVHVADEPADIVRELGIFFDRPYRLRLFGALGKGLDVSAEVFAEINDHSGDRADLDFDRALRRMSELAGQLPKVVAEELEGLLDLARAGRAVRWRSLLELADRHGLPVSRWDRAAIGARLGARHLDGAPTVPDIAGDTRRNPLTDQVTTVTVALLAKAKALPAETLIRYGLRDSVDGVLFSYRNLDGKPARTRLRHGMRGADGSRWLPGDEEIAPYTNVDMQRLAAERGYHILVEGESDCWAAWHHDFPAIGIPGPDRYSTITLGHLAGVRTLYLQAEAESAVTYPDGVDKYLAAVAAHLRTIGFIGDLLLLRHIDGIDDLADLHLQHADRFTEYLRAAFDQAEPIDLV